MATVEDFLNDKLGAAPEGTPAPAPAKGPDPFEQFLNDKLGEDAQARAVQARQEEGEKGFELYPGEAYIQGGLNAGFENLVGLPGTVQRYFGLGGPQLPTTAELHEDYRKGRIAAGLKVGEPTSALGRVGQQMIGGLETAPEAMLPASVLSAGAGAGAAEVTDNPYLVAGAGLVGGLGASAGQNAVRGAMARSAARGEYNAATEGLAKLQAPVAAEQFSQGQAAAKTLLQRNVADQSAQIKTTADAAHEAALASATQVAQNTDQVTRGGIEGQAQALGQSRTVEDVGTNAQAKAHDFAESIPDQIEKTFVDADKLVDRDKTFVVPSAFESVAQRLAREAGPGTPIAQKFGANAGQQVVQGFQQMRAIDEARETLGLPPQGNMTVRQAVTLKGLIGEAQLGKGPLKDVGEKQLSQLYGALNSDIRESYASISDEAADAYDKANGAAKDIYDFAGKKGPLSKVIAARSGEAETKDPKAVGASLMKMSGAGLSALRERLPNVVDEAAAGLLRSDPDAWGALSPEQKAAFVPNQARRTNLDQIQALRDSNKATLQSAKDTAKSERDRALSGQGQLLETFKRGEQDRLTQEANARAMQVAQLKEQQAKAALLGGPKVPTTADQAKALYYKLASGLGGGAGFSAGLGQLLSGTAYDLGGGLATNAAMGALAGGALALGAPAVGAAVKSTVQNPNVLLGALGQAGRAQKGQGAGE